MIPGPRGGARRAGATGRADRVRGRSEEAGGREERFPLPARRRLHQTEEPRPGAHRLQLQTQHQGKEASRKHSVYVSLSHSFKCHHLLLLNAQCLKSFKGNSRFVLVSKLNIWEEGTDDTRVPV